MPLFSLQLGLGMKGDVLSVEKRLARSTLLPSGVAMYASPENLEANEEERKVRMVHFTGVTKLLVL